MLFLKLMSGLQILFRHAELLSQIKDQVLKLLSRYWMTLCQICEKMDESYAQQNDLSQIMLFLYFNTLKRDAKETGFIY